MFNSISNNNFNSSQYPTNEIGNSSFTSPMEIDFNEIVIQTAKPEAVNQSNKKRKFDEIEESRETTEPNKRTFLKVQKSIGAAVDKAKMSFMQEIASRAFGALVSITQKNLEN